MSSGQSYSEMPKNPEWFTKGYRALASFYHPDNKVTGDEEKMKEINIAYDNKDKITILNELKELKRVLDQKEKTEIYQKIKRAEIKPEWEIVSEIKTPEVEINDFSFTETTEDEEREKQEKLLKIEKAIDDLIIAEEKRKILQNQKDELDELASKLGIKKEEKQINTDYSIAHEKYVEALNELSLLTKKSEEQIKEEYL